MGSRVTWDELVRQEPMLQHLERVIRYGALSREGLERTWAYRFKPQIAALVGFERNDAHATLSSPEAYEVAMLHLRSLLELRDGL